MREDTELLRQYASTNSEEAFGELVRRHVNLVYGAALRQTHGDSHCAQEIAQTVFTLLARKAPVLASHPNLIGWLYTTTHFTVRELMRREQRRARREQEAYLMQDDAGYTTSGDAPLRAELDGAMQALSERDRQALLLRFFEGRTFGEVGRQMAVTEAAARMRVERALEKLRLRLVRRGITSTASALGATLVAEAAHAAPTTLAAKIASSAVLSGASGSAVVLGFMATTKTIMTIGSVALFMLGAAFQQSRAARTAAAARDAMQQSVTALESELAEADGRRSTLERAAQAAKPAPAAVGQPLERRPLDSEAKRQNEAARLAYNGQWREYANRAYSVMELLELTPEKKTKFVELAERELDAARFANWFGNHTVEGYGNLLGEEWRRELRATLGEAAYARYEHLEAARDAVVPLSSYLANSAIPLEPAQAKHLLHFLADRAGRWRDDRGRITEGTMAEAKGILSPAQMAAWRRLETFAAVRESLLEQARQAERIRQTATTTAPR
jgi:RNA polymerase sigma factor (sigma-70 family)